VQRLVQFQRQLLCGLDLAFQKWEIETLQFERTAQRVFPSEKREQKRRTGNYGLPLKVASQLAGVLKHGFGRGAERGRLVGRQGRERLPNPVQGEAGGDKEKGSLALLLFDET
jgi:hypothetical protein